MATHLPGPSWRDLKKELMEKWHELSENELDRTNGNAPSVIDLIEKKVGLAFEEASKKFQEMASRYQLYDAPEEQKPPSQAVQDKAEKVMELSPKKPAGKDPKPRDPFHTA